MHAFQLPKMYIQCACLT